MSTQRPNESLQPTWAFPHSRATSHGSGVDELLSLARNMRTVFFRGQLYHGLQPESGWERRAQREASAGTGGLTRRRTLAVCSRVKFAVHVLCGNTDLEIKADELRIQRA